MVIGYPLTSAVVMYLDALQIVLVCLIAWLCQASMLGFRSGRYHELQFYYWSFHVTALFACVSIKSCHSQWGCQTQGDGMIDFTGHMYPLQEVDEQKNVSYFLIFHVGISD